MGRRAEERCVVVASSLRPPVFQSFPPFHRTDGSVEMLSRRVASAVERSAAWAGLRRGQCGGARAGSVSWTDARFGGATLVLRAGPLPEPEQLEKEFAVAMGEVRAADKKGVWLRLGLEQGNALGIAAKHGFRFHHADGEYAMLLNWLPKGRCPVRGGWRLRGEEKRKGRGGGQELRGGVGIGRHGG